MTKQEFIARLRHGLSALPSEDVEERLTFYSEMIDDRIDEGLSENDAVAAVGSTDDIIAQILADTPRTKQQKPRRLRSWEIVLLILGSPVWVSLLIAATAVAVALYASAWAVIVSCWAVMASLAACAAYGVAAGIGTGQWALIGAGSVCAGLAILCFFACRAVTRGLVRLTTACFGKKGVAV